MTSSRVATWSAVVAAAAWGLKALVIWVAGGLDESPLEGPLFVVGLLALLVAFVAAGVAVVPRRSRRVPVGVVGGVVGLVVGFVAFLVVESAVGALVPDSWGWVREEAGLWVAAVAAVLTAAVLQRSHGSGRGDLPPAP